MKRLILCSLLLVMLLMVSLMPMQAQDEYDCVQAKADADILAALAQEYLANDEVTTAFAILNGARALLRPCLTEAPADAVRELTFEQGFGVEKGFWQVYFTAPTGSSDRNTYTGGVDAVVVTAINAVQSTLDIAAFEWNNPRITQAVIDAAARGVTVRMVVDDEHALEDSDSTIEQVIDAGIPVVDDGRSGLMHNKFMIMDGGMVLFGSMNFTMNDTYRNNNNFMVVTAPEAIAAYQAEFDEMFVEKQFGSSRSAHNEVRFVQDGTDIQILFSPEGPVVDSMLERISNAQSSIRFMTFSFTLDEIGAALLAKAEAGVAVEGIFEVRGSETSFSELPAMFCAGLDVYQDGNPFTFHHKVFIIDDNIVMTGSFNISDSATNNNDENMVIIQDADLAAQYIAEYERVKAQAVTPDSADFDCS